jgi:hypothetical protein
MIDAILIIKKLQSTETIEIRNILLKALNILLCKLANEECCTFIGKKPFIFLLNTSNAKLN